MHDIGSVMLSIIYDVYQCISVDLKWLQAIEICFVVIGRLRQNSPTNVPEFLIFHVSGGYGIQHFVHIVSWKSKP